MRPAIALFLTAATVSWATTAVARDDDGDQTIPLNGATTIEVHSATGRIQIHADHDGNIVVERGQVNVVRTKNRVLLQARDSITVRVPKTWLEVRTQAGSVDVSGTYDQVLVHTSAGRVEVHADADEVEVTTLAGRVEVRGRAKRVRVNSVAGSLEIEVDGLESLRAKTTNGRIEVEAEKLAKQLEVESVNGRIEVKGALVKGADIRVTTLSGRIGFERTNKQGYRLRAKTKYGRIDVHGSKRRGDDTWIETIDGGGAEVRLDTFGGPIEVK